MPDLGRCEVIDGRLICWDKEHEMYVEVITVNIYDRDFIKKVISTFMKNNDLPNKEKEKIDA